MGQSQASLARPSQQDQFSTHGQEREI